LLPAHSGPEFYHGEWENGLLSNRIDPNTDLAMQSPIFQPQPRGYTVIAPSNMAHSGTTIRDHIPGTGSFRLSNPVMGAAVLLCADSDSAFEEEIENLRHRAKQQKGTIFFYPEMTWSEDISQFLLRSPNTRNFF
jgi:predicted RNA methylase